MIILKTKHEIETMRHGGRITGAVLSKLLKAVKPGIRTRELDMLAGELIRKAGGVPSFPMVPGYKWNICTTVNEVVVHGIPGEYSLEEGDILGIDIGVFYEGFHTDAAWSVVVGNQELKNYELSKQFLSVGKKALEGAIRAAKIDNTIGDIGYSIRSVIEETGYSVVREFIGHGVGKKLHEDPPVPGYGKSGSGPKLRSGMTLAIEVIYTMRKPDVRILNDNWTVVSTDRSVSGLFEHSIAITDDGPIVLTAGSNSDTL